VDFILKINGWAAWNVVIQNNSPSYEPIIRSIEYMIYLLKDLTYVGQRDTESRIRQIHLPISELKRNIPMFRCVLNITAAVSTEAKVLFRNNTPSFQQMLYIER